MFVKPEKIVLFVDNISQDFSEFSPTDLALLTAILTGAINENTIAVAKARLEMGKPVEWGWLILLANGNPNKAESLAEEIINLELKQIPLFVNLFWVEKG